MLKIDIILPPPFLYFRKYQRFFFPIYRKNVNWFPVWYYHQELLKRNIKIRFLNILNLNYDNLSKIVCIDNEILNLINNFDNVLKKLRRKVDNLFWFDHSDSASLIQTDVLPYVDRYLKKQVLKDRSLYYKKFINDRIFCDFYAKNYNINKMYKKASYQPTELTTSEKKCFKPIYEKKIGLSWNLAFCDYRYLWDKRIHKKLGQIIFLFSNKMKIKYIKPSLNRKLIFSANFSDFLIDSVLVGFQRHELLKILNEKYKSNQYASIGMFPKKKYLQNAASSKAIFSPFGFGEICFRDFEAFIAGAALIKPNIDHIETWPDLYKKDNTYIPLSWKIEEWETAIPEILKDDKLLFQIARNGQISHKKLWTKEGRENFCDHFIEIIEPK